MEFDPVLYTPIIDKILKSSELAAVSAKDVRKLLQKELGYDISHQKAEISNLVKERFENLLEVVGPANVHPVKQEQNPTNGHSNSVKKESGDGSDPPSAKKRKSVAGPVEDHDARLAAKLQAEWNLSDRPSRSTAVKRKPVIPRRRGKQRNATISDDSGAEDHGEKRKRKINPNNPFHAQLILSPQLSEFLNETQLSRPETVKRIWVYIKANNLQDQSDRRYIICDDKLRTIFNTDKVHMFTMNKILSTHLYPMDKIVPVKTEDTVKTEEGSSPLSSQDGNQFTPASSESDAHSSQVEA